MLNNSFSETGDFFDHHASALIGSSDVLLPYLLARLEKSGITKLANPDFFHEAFEVLTIDDSRRIREVHESRPFSSEVPRVFIIEIHGATREAQNALLKTLEEPRPDNFFFIILPSVDILLATVRSRLRIWNTEFSREYTKDSSKNANQQIGEDFLKMNLAEKIAFADDFAARISDEKATKNEAVLFLNSLERELRVSMLKAHSDSRSNFDSTNTTTPAPLNTFKTIATARDYMNDRASSVKMLLEYVALSLEAR